MQPIDQAEIARFFGSFWGRDWSPLQLAVTAFPSSGPPVVRWATSPDVAAAHAAKLATANDVYMTCGLRPANAPETMGATKYGTAADVMALVSAWLDIDMASPYRKAGHRLPETEDEAMDIIGSMGAEPTYLIYSGYGLQPHWVFPSPWKLTTPEQRDEAALLLEAWHIKAQAAAKRLGYDVDSKQSLATVLRVPGTLNRKGWASEKIVKPVLAKNSGPRYSVDRLFELCGEAVEEARQRRRSAAALVTSSSGGFRASTNINPAMGGGSAGTIQVSSLIVDPKAEPPAVKFAALFENSDKFADTWNRARADLKDQTQSGYDLSLACLAVGADWTDQEVTDLLIAHRRAGDGRGPEKPRHYARVIAKARAMVKTRVELAAKREEEKDETSLIVAVAEATAEGTDATVKLLREKLNIPELEGFLQRGRDPASYYLKLAGKPEIRLGSAKSVLSLPVVKAVVLEASDRILPKMKAAAWDKIVEALFSIKKVEELQEGDRAKETLDWISAYIESRGNLPDESLAETDERENGALKDAVLAKNPYLNSTDGLIYFNSTGLFKYLKLADMVQLSLQELRARLAELGLKSTPSSTKIGKVVTRRSYWAVAMNILAGQEPAATG